jgi:hypothetical protein
MSREGRGGVGVSEFALYTVNCEVSWRFHNPETRTTLTT